MTFKSKSSLVLAVALIAMTFSYNANAELVLRGESFDTDLPATWTSLGSGSFNAFVYAAFGGWAEGTQGAGGNGNLRSQSVNNNQSANGDPAIGTLDPATDDLHFHGRLKVNTSPAGGDQVMGWMNTSSAYFSGGAAYPDGLFVYQGGGATRLFAMVVAGGTASILEVPGAGVNIVREVMLVYDPASTGSLTLTVKGVGAVQLDLNPGDKAAMGTLDFFGAASRNLGGGVSLSDCFWDELVYTINTPAVGTSSEGFGPTLPPANFDTTGFNIGGGGAPQVVPFAGPLAGSTGDEIRAQINLGNTGRFAAEIAPVDLDTDVLYASVNMFITNTNVADITFGWFESTNAFTYTDGVFAGFFGAPARIDTAYSLSGTLGNYLTAAAVSNQNTASVMELTYDPTRNGTVGIRYQDADENVVGYRILAPGDKSSMPALDRFGLRGRNSGTPGGVNDIIMDDWTFSGTVVPVELSSFSIE